NATRRLIVLRAIDKYDRLGWEGVEQLLGSGRKDESGDFTRGAELNDFQIKRIEDFLFKSGLERHTPTSGGATDESGWKFSSLETIDGLVGDSELEIAARDELRRIFEATESAGYDSGQIRFDGSIVRGLEYYAGPVFEAELIFPMM